MLPAIVASAIRYIIISLVQLGIFQAAVDYILPLIQKAITEIMKVMGVSEQTAKDIFSNELIQYAESVGVFAATLKTKMPVKIAEYLGFTTKGFKLRVIEQKTVAAVNYVKDKVSGMPLIGMSTADDILPTIAAAAKAPLVTVKGAFDTIMKVLGVGFLGAMTVGNFLDFGNWNNGAYQGTFQKLWSRVGLNPDQDFSKPQIVSDEMFGKIYNTFKLEGAKTIKNPTNGQILPFSRDNLIMIIDKIAAGMNVAGEKLTAQKLIGLVTAITTFETPTVVSQAPAIKANTYTPPAIEAPKVFTGIIANGKLSLTPDFIPRADSLIESVAELQEAAFNNLSEYLAALPGRVTYELKLVSSVVDTDGIRRQGSQVDVLSGYNKDGSARYRKVTNRWAIITLYFVKKSGGRIKIDEIILGPTDAAKLNPNINTLLAVNNSIKANITTSDISDIKIIQTSNPIALQPTPAPQPQPTPTPAPQPQPTPTPAPQPQPTPTPAPQPQPTPTPAPQPQPTPTPAPQPQPTPQSQTKAPVGGFSIYLTPIQRYAAAEGAEYYKFPDSPDVYETASGRHVQYDEAVAKNIWSKIKTINRF